MSIDFGYEQNNNIDNNGSDSKNDDSIDSTDLTTGKIQHGSNTNDADDIDNKDTNKNDDFANKKDNNSINKKDNKNDDDDSNKNNVDNTLQPGTSIEVGDEIYTVDDKGNVIDKNGNIFKESSEVKNWIDSFDEFNDSTENISIDSIKNAIGIEITDDYDNPIEFDNTPAGIKSYIDAVIDTAKEEHYEAAINTLYNQYPILQDVLNYYIANGNSLEGFGEIPDRSNITIDTNNELQQENIIRTAWKERGQKGDIDGYINFLKSSGSLLATAKQELEAIQESDNNYRANLAKEAERKEQERIQTLENYWNGVHEVIKTRNIAGYKIPESIIINRNNQKLSVTPEDFFNYIYRVDKNGKSAYERDLMEETPESRRDDEILRAYLKFVGGNYSNLVNMAINKEKVNTLKLRAKERNNSSIKINKPNNTAVKANDIDLGYN